MNSKIIRRTAMDRGGRAISTIIGQNWQWVLVKGKIVLTKFNFPERPTVARTLLHRADGDGIASTNIFRYSGTDADGHPYTREPGLDPIINDERVNSVTWA